MMNLKSKFLFIATICLITSCGKPEEPAVSVYVSALSSNTYSKVDFVNKGVRFTKLDEEGKYEKIVTELRFDQVDVSLDLSDPEPVFIYERGLEPGLYGGLRLAPIDIKVLQSSGIEISTFNRTNPTSAIYDFNFELKENTNYRIDYVYDFDDSINPDSLSWFIPKVQFIITEL